MRLGTVEEVLKLYQSGKLQQMLKEGPKPIIVANPDKDPEFPAYPSSIDRWIDGAEWLLRGLANAFGPKEDSKKENSLTTSHTPKPSPLDVDFPVLRTNWYWRRTLSFYTFTH